MRAPSTQRRESIHLIALKHDDTATLVPSSQVIAGLVKLHCGQSVGYRGVKRTVAMFGLIR